MSNPFRTSDELRAAQAQTEDALKRLKTAEAEVERLSTKPALSKNDILSDIALTCPDCGGTGRQVKR